MTFRRALMSSTAIMAATGNHWEKGEPETVKLPNGLVETLSETVRLKR